MSNVQGPTNADFERVRMVKKADFDRLKKKSDESNRQQNDISKQEKYLANFKNIFDNVEDQMKWNEIETISLRSKSMNTIRVPSNFIRLKPVDGTPRNFSRPGVYVCFVKGCAMVKDNRLTFGLLAVLPNRLEGGELTLCCAKPGAVTKEGVQLGVEMLYYQDDKNIPAQLTIVYKLRDIELASGPLIQANLQSQLQRDCVKACSVTFQCLMKLSMQVLKAKCERNVTE